MDKKRVLLIAAGALALPLIAMPALAQGAVADNWKWLTFLVFGAIISVTMYVTYVAAKRVKTAADFYAAGGGVSGLQNGWAIAGDYLSAASFLGIAGLISLYGYDGFMYSVGWLVAYITVLLVIAEPCRNIGKYTLSDILAYRNDPKKARIVGAISTITVSTFYLTAQMVGAGVLIKTLIGIDYEVSVITVGVLMLAYVLFGGMVATTWVQIIKAVLLVCASILMVILVWSQYGFFGDFLTERRRRREGPGPRRRADRRQGFEPLCHATRPDLPRARTVPQGAAGPDLSGHGTGVRHGRHAAHPDAVLHGAHGAGGAHVGELGDGHHRRLLRADAVPWHGRSDEGRPHGDRRHRSGRQHGQSAAGAGPGRRPRLAGWQPLHGLCLGRCFCHHRRRGCRTGAGGSQRDGPRPLRRRDPQGARDTAGAGQGSTDRHRLRRRNGYRHRHLRQGPERGAPGGPGLRGGFVRQLPVRTADAVLEALQHGRHRGSA